MGNAWPRVVTVAVVLSLGVLVMACGDSGAGTPLLTSPVEWSATEVLRIGSVDDPATALSPVGSLAVDADGRIYVPQSASGSIRVFGVDGQALGIYGASGDGPGEFRQITRLGIFADTLFVSDLAARRVTLFSLDGRVLETLSLAPEGLGEDWVPVVPWWLDGDGRAVALPGYLPVLRDPNAAYRVMLVRIDRTGEIVDTVALTDRPPQLRIRLQGPFGALLADQPFATPFLPVTSAHGSPVAVLGDPRPKSGQGGVLDITVLRSLQDTVWSQSFTYEGVPLSAAVVDQVVGERVRRLSREAFPDRDDAEAQFRAEMSLPDHVPPLSGGLFADDGSLWLRRADTLADVQRWTVIDPQGVPIAEVTLPRSLKVEVVRSTSLWGVDTDELGVPYIVRYAIER